MMYGGVAHQTLDAAALAYCSEMLMDDFKVHKDDKNALSRGVRLALSVLDPRAWAHLLKVVNYYNYIHVAEWRQVRRGRGVRIGPTVSLVNGRNIEIGDRARIGAGSSLWGGPGKGRIVIGADTLVAPNVMMTAANYRFNDGAPINAQAMDEADVVVGKDAWIGYGAVLVAGSHVGDGAIVAAGSVVRGRVPDYAVVGGNPATVIGYRARPGEASDIRADESRESNETIRRIIAEELPWVDQGALAAPLDDVGVDSFTLISLRTAIETRCRVTIPDREWTGVRSLADIDRLPSVAAINASRPNPTPPKAAEAAPPAPSPAKVHSAAIAIAGSGRSSRSYSLNMPQMALSGLGESWLFKEIGDIHWHMITDFLGSPSAAIADDAGERLYATFTRIFLEAKPSLDAFQENDLLHISSSLERFGAGFFFGSHDVSAPGASCRATTMSTFAKYGERGRNTSLMKGVPNIVNPDAIPSLEILPDFGAEYRKRRESKLAGDIFECEYEILPPHDINGVGLLYFAAYPTIFDICLDRYEGKGFLLEHSTVSKDIYYFANSEPTETLLFQLHARELQNGLVHHVVSLSRKSDGKRMSEAISVKRPITSRRP